MEGRLEGAFVLDEGQLRIFVGRRFDCLAFPPSWMTSVFAGDQVGPGRVALELVVHGRT
jgi:hypothetical protein